jgi:hypothetical protein
MLTQTTDRNLLFGVLALQADFLDAAQFAEACGPDWAPLPIPPIDAWQRESF